MSLNVTWSQVKKIMIIGCGGAGKSTLSRQLQAILGIEVIHFLFPKMKILNFL
ncbi:MAG: hypothetical protein KME30_03855 [Iphinoe sp. HA4291-MV1]|jgi:ABC-type phosphate/phosphonate transport system ATPase subunit|nr:hypothetical protein [Iphinoe sp. HA4291-MV1]